VSVEELTVREALRSGIREEMDRDESVFLMGQDEELGGTFEVTTGLYEEYGRDRVRDTPISETAQIGAGVGSAATGLRPVVNVSFADFLAICYEPLMNQAAKMRYMFGGEVAVPLTIRAVEGAGLNAAAQHSSTVHSMVVNLPGVKAVAPGTPVGAKGLMKSAIRADDPVVVFENKAIYERTGDVPEDVDVPLGEGRVVHPGTDVTVVATQQLLGESIRIAERRDDVAIEVIDPQTLSPLDTETVLDSVEKTGRLVVADESPLAAGFQAEVVCRVIETGFGSLDAPPQRVGIPDTPIPFSPPMEDEVVPDQGDVEAAIERTLA
jgi:pyruvate dehydrogenase E1 component beta subunit